MRNAQNYYGEPVLAGTYDGGPLNAPMRGLTAAQPLGAVTKPPPQTAPEFGVFVLIKNARPGAGAGAVRTSLQ